MEGTKKIISMSFHQYSWNSEVETTWISLIGWYHKTSNVYVVSVILAKFEINVMAKFFHFEFDFGIVSDFLQYINPWFQINKRSSKVSMANTHFKLCLRGTEYVGWVVRLYFVTNRPSISKQWCYIYLSITYWHYTVV